MGMMQRSRPTSLPMQRRQPEFAQQGRSRLSKYGLTCHSGSPTAVQLETDREEGTMKRFLLNVAVLAGLAAPGVLIAQTYPSKPVRVIHGYGAGAPLDAG